MNRFVLILFLACLFFSCKTDNKDYDLMAKDLCNCMRPLADINVKIKKLVDEGKTDEVAALFSEVEKLSNEGEICAVSLEEKYGKVEGESEDKATAALQKHCPDIARMLEEKKDLDAGK